MSTMLWGEDEGRTARAINRRDERARLARHIAAEFDLTITSVPPRIDWTGVAIAAVTFGLLCGVWLGVAWLVFRRITDG